MKRGLVALLVLPLAACGGGDTLDHEGLVDQLHAWAVKQGAADSVRVDCPDDIPLKAGTEFHCLMRGGGDTVRVTVTVENDDGYVTWVAG